MFFILIGPTLFCLAQPFPSNVKWTGGAEHHLLADSEHCTLDGRMRHGGLDRQVSCSECVGVLMLFYDRTDREVFKFRIHRLWLKELALCSHFQTHQRCNSHRYTIVQMLLVVQHRRALSKQSWEINVHRLSLSIFVSLRFDSRQHSGEEPLSEAAKKCSGNWWAGAAAPPSLKGFRDSYKRRPWPFHQLCSSNWRVFWFIITAAPVT